MSRWKSSFSTYGMAVIVARSTFSTSRSGGPAAPRPDVDVAPGDRDLVAQDAAGEPVAAAGDADLPPLAEQDAGERRRRGTDVDRPAAGGARDREVLTLVGVERRAAAGELHAALGDERHPAPEVGAAEVDVTAGVVDAGRQDRPDRLPGAAGALRGHVVVGGTRLAGQRGARPVRRQVGPEREGLDRGRDRGRREAVARRVGRERAGVRRRAGHGLAGPHEPQLSVGVHPAPDVAAAAAPVQGRGGTRGVGPDGDRRHRGTHLDRERDDGTSTVVVGRDDVGDEAAAGGVRVGRDEGAVAGLTGRHGHALDRPVTPVHGRGVGVEQARVGDAAGDPAGVAGDRRLVLEGQRGRDVDDVDGDLVGRVASGRVRDGELEDLAAVVGGHVGGARGRGAVQLQWELRRPGARRGPRCRSPWSRRSRSSPRRSHPRRVR